MGYGILAGMTWAVETVALGIVLSSTVFTESARALFLAPFAAAFFHDCFSSLWVFFYHLKKGTAGNIKKALRTKSGKGVMLAAAIGGPVGMSGYILAVANLGPAVGAGVSAVYPAVGAVLACIFLKEKMPWYRWGTLLITILGVFGLGYSPGIQMANVTLGIAGAFLCALGWGMEGVIIAKCVKEDAVNNETALQIRQITSALIYGAAVLPVLHGWDFLISAADALPAVMPMTALAACFASVSYLCYYKAIEKIGVSKAMALNISYAAWAGVFSLVILHDTSILHPMTIVCILAVMTGSLATAYDRKNG